MVWFPGEAGHITQDARVYMLINRYPNLVKLRLGQGGLVFYFMPPEQGISELLEYDDFAGGLQMDYNPPRMQRDGVCSPNSTFRKRSRLLMYTYE